MGPVQPESDSRHHAWPKRWARQNGKQRPPSSGLVQQNQAEHRDERQRSLLCAHCGHTITNRDQAITISGGHEHTFVNPAGLVFTVRLFRHTPGCRFQGNPSSEFSWFPGYLWRLALCGGCGQHLGWLFQGGGGEFTALIAATIHESG